MNAETLLSTVTHAAILFIFAAVLLEAVRAPRRLAYDAVLFFAAMTGIITVTALTRLRLIEPGQTGLLSSVLLLLLPYLQLRMVDDFAGVPRRIQALAAGVAFGSVLSLYLVERPFSAAYILAVIGGFVAVQGYCTVVLVRAVRSSVGVTRGRTQALALGSAMLVTVIVVAGLQVFLPEFRPALRGMSSVASLTCGVGYFIGFTPPRWLRRLWQAPAIRAFLSMAARLPADATPAQLADQLERAVTEAVGARRSYILVWDEDERRLTALNRAHASGPQATRHNSTLPTRVFREQRALAVDNAPRMDPGNADLYQGAGALSLLIAPITLGDQRFGVLVASNDRPSNFAADDLALIELLADEIAGLLRRHQLTDAAAHVRAQAEATQLKDEFLSAAAHDLRTPLTVILAQAQLLSRRLHRGGAATEDLLGGIDRLVQEAQRMRRLTDDVLDASRSEATGFVAEVAPADLVAIAYDVAGSVTSERHQVLVEGAEAWALVDGDRIRQVMQNLVDNAVKFSPAGGTISICCERAGDEAMFSVKDHGIGIPPWDLPHLFQRFYRGGRSGERGFSGMGIGLFLCKRIVEEHGGTITVDSVYGQGTRFLVTLAGATAEQGRTNATAHSGR
ncbi:MAG: ATP-binding protein [Dehalococcoidia bacterium]